MIVLCCWLAPAALDGARAQPGGGHFVEFRARPSGDIGHNHILYGRLDGRGRIVERRYAGLIPKVSGWRGLIAPVNAYVGHSAADVHTPPLARYRIGLSAVEFARLTGTVRRLRRTQHRWHAMFFNCNDFSIAIADAIGLRRPPNLMPPQAWIAGLRLLNERRVELRTSAAR